MRIFTIAAAAAAASLFAAAAGAQTTYADRTAFNAAAGAVTTVDFEDQGTTTVGLGTDQTVTSGGATFAPQPGFGLYVAGPGQSSNPTTALGVDTPAGGALSISFSSPASAFGADFFQNFGGGQQSGSDAAFTLDVFSGALLLQTFNFAVPSDGGAFFGFTGVAPFDLVEVSQAGGFAVVDNVSFATGVPEPAAWGLMILGVGLVGGSLRARRGTAQVAFG